MQGIRSSRERAYAVLRSCAGRQLDCDASHDREAVVGSGSAGVSRC